MINQALVFHDIFKHLHISNTKYDGDSLKEEVKETILILFIFFLHVNKKKRIWAWTLP